MANPDIREARRCRLKCAVPPTIFSQGESVGEIEIIVMCKSEFYSLRFWAHYVLKIKDAHYWKKKFPHVESGVEKLFNQLWAMKLLMIEIIHADVYKPLNHVVL